MASTETLDDHTPTTARRRTEATPRGRATLGRRTTGAWRPTVMLTRRLVRAVLRVTVTTTGTAVGFVLLVLGIGGPILREVERMADDRTELALDRTVGRAGALRGALVVTGRSWRELARAVVTFSLAAVVWFVPLSLMSIPVLLAVGIEPTARVVSRGWEVGITSWGPALACAAVGAALVPTVPTGLRRLASKAELSHGQESPASATSREVGR